MSMQRLVTSVLVLGFLPVSSMAVAMAQSGGTTLVTTARAANAPPLVPVRLNADGNFRIAPPYVADPAFTAKPDVPKGRVIRFTMNSAESKLFPTAPVGRGGGPGGARGEPAPESLPSRRNIKRFNGRSPSTFLPGTFPIPHLPSSSYRTNGGLSRKTPRPLPMARRAPISRSCR